MKTRQMLDLIEENQIVSTGDPTFDTFRLILLFFRENKTTPSITEIAEGLASMEDSSINSPSSGNVHRYLTKLDKVGLIVKRKGERRISVPGSIWTYIDEETTRQIINGNRQFLEGDMVG